jgi:hypothetical protein
MKRGPKCTPVFQAKGLKSLREIEEAKDIKEMRRVKNKKGPSDLYPFLFI